MGDLGNPLILDTNLVLRFLLGDLPSQKAKVEALFSGNTKLIFLDVVAAEVVWVLSRSYAVAKPEISASLLKFLELPTVEANKELLQQALVIWNLYSISYIDAYLVAQARSQNLVLLTFDKDLAKVKEVVIQEP